MIKKLAKHGNSYAIVISKPIMQLLGIDPQSHIDLKIEKGGLFLRPVVQEKAIVIVSKNPKIQRVFEKNLKKYRPALKKLSKN